jgi:diguanylate cyclase
VDYFKEINDTHGHEVGDAILTALVARLTKLGPDAAIIARLGGDEFGVLFTGSDAASASHLFAQGIVDAMQEPIDCDGAIITASVSVGLMSGGDPEVLTRNADVALYSAKQRGRNRVVTFDAALHRSLLHRLEVRDRLTEAVATSQITIVYQPIVDLATGQLHGFEALARWNDRELGHVSPDVFIAVAEEAGLISELGRFVLNTSCQQLAQWRAYFPQLNLSMSVNLAPRQLEDPNLTAYVATALKTYELPATSLQLELTESAFTSQRRHEDHLKRLRDLGVRLAIDDFGSAESTLARLHTVPASTLKIDRAFLLESDTEPERCRRLLSAVVGIANALGMTTVAEGIETPEQLAIIKDVGCTYGQGYLHSRPLSAEDATAFLQQG